MPSQSSTVRRLSFTAGPDCASVGEEVVVLGYGNRLGIIPEATRAWGMSAEVMKVGQSLAFHGFARPGSIRLAPVVGDDFVTIVFVFEGTLKISESGDESLIANRGEALFFRSGQDRSITWPVETSYSGVMVPLEVLEEFGVDVTLATGVIGAQEFLSRPSASFLRELSSNRAPATALTAYFVERMMHEVVGSVLLSKRGFDSGIEVPTTHVHRRALALMTAQRADPLLTPASLAEQLNISLRQLQREFQVKGESVAAVLRQLRVQLAIQLLQDRTYRGLSVEQIARESGFRSGQVMRKALADCGVPSPNEMRKMAAVMAA